MLFQLEDGRLVDWPDCLVEGCPNQACLRLNSPFCWPHTMHREPDVEECAEKVEEGSNGQAKS